jgi:hypothetical protein
MEAVRLRIAPRRLGLTEYVDFQLYRQDLDWNAKRAFGGQRAQAAAEELLIDDYSRFLSLDKVTMYTLLSGFNLPTPEVRAVYRSTRPSRYTQLRTPSELIGFLQQPTNLPIYLKRSFGSYGKGNVLVNSVQNEQVLLGNKASESLDQFARSLDDGRSLGWILQQPLTPNRQIGELTGSMKISGLRIHTFMGRSEPKLHKAILKLNAGILDTDNFEHGASGNMLAAVDIGTGRVVRAISGVGLQQAEIESHARTGAKIVDFQIPHWDKVVALVLDAQKAFPGFICPGWDIALCEEGPKILEVNAFGDIDLSQHAYRSSFFDHQFLLFLEERGLIDLLDQRSGKNTRSSRNNRVGVRRHHWLW